MTEATPARLTTADLPRAKDDLAEILHACVHAGASVGFILPFAPDDAAAYWTGKVFPAVRSGGAVLFAARRDGRIAGTVQLGIDLMPNQPHRADVAKLLVHPDHRRLGIARALMQALERDARARGKTLLVLDTRSGDPSQRLYESLGFQVAGEIPDYCRNPFRAEYEATTYLYKALT